MNHPSYYEAWEHNVFACDVLTGKNGKWDIDERLNAQNQGWVYV
jgi:uncharacterized protein (DUF779 family)